jgi:YjbE family integral membrane protein
MGFELTPAFWSGLFQIILVNIILSGDNALVIALACRNLDKRHQKPAILIGSAGAIVLRIIFVLIVDQLLKIGYLKLVGGLLLLWIGVKLVQGEEEGEGGVKAAGSLWTAIRTIIIADAVMSLDNAIAIAAAAKGDVTLIVLGLLISIPLIIFGATLIMMLLNRFPIIVIAGGGLLAGSPARCWRPIRPMPRSSPRCCRTPRRFRDRRRRDHGGARLLPAVPRQAAHACRTGRPCRRKAADARSSEMAKMKAILVPVDGSANSDRRVKHALDLSRRPVAELHFLNVQPNLGRRDLDFRQPRSDRFLSPRGRPKSSGLGRRTRQKASVPPRSISASGARRDRARLRQEARRRLVVMGTAATPAWPVSARLRRAGRHRPCRTSGHLVK